MHKLRIFYNQNKKKIWKVIGVIVFLYAIIQLLNYMVSHKNNVVKNNNNISSTSEYTDLSLRTDKSVLSKQKISSSKEDSINAINEFFSYCNDGKVEEAYNLLTDECKEEMFQKQDDFRNNYFKSIFNGTRKEISAENWIDNIYKIYITEDALSTGIYGGGNTKQDYITVNEIDNGIYKLNINGYIERKELRKTVQDYDIEFNVIRKDVYMNYEIYTFEITNKSALTILLDDLIDIDSMYIQDSNENKYSAYTHEILSNDLLIEPQERKQVAIKYYNKYSSSKDIKSINFTRLILDYDLYMELKEKDGFRGFKECKIDL